MSQFDNTRDVTFQGFTSVYGKRWFAGTASYADAIPTADARALLAMPHVIAAPMSVQLPDGRTMADPSRVVIARHDTGRILNVPSRKYGIHQYVELFDRTAAAVADSATGLQVASVGTLDYGGSMYAQFQLPGDIVRNASGVEIAPFLCVTSSHDGSMKTDIAEGNTVIICRNTWAMARGEMASNIAAGRGISTKHTANSLEKITAENIRERLDLAFAASAEEGAFLDMLAGFTITDTIASKFVQALYPIADAAPVKAVQAAERNRAAWIETYRTDPRVAPWSGSAFGILQAADTRAQNAPTRKVDGGLVDPFGRNIRAFASGDVARAQLDTLNVLQGVLRAAKGRTLQLV